MDSVHNYDFAQFYPKLTNAGILPAYDSFEKKINQYVYDGKLPEKCTDDEKRAYRTRLIRLFDNYKELWQHESGYPKVCSALILDALETGNWKDLPDCLQAEYHKQFNEMVDEFISDAQDAEEDYEIQRDMRAYYYVTSGLNIIKVLQDRLQDTLASLKKLEQYTAKAVGRDIVNRFTSDIPYNGDELDYDIETVEQAVGEYGGIL